MRSLRRPVRLVVAASAAAVALTACSDEGGDGLPGDPNTPPATQVSTTPSSTPGGGGGELATIKSCDLLTGDEAATISNGFAVKNEGPLGGSSDTCSWETSVDRGIPIDKHVTVSIAIRPRQTVDETNVGIGRATDGEVGDGRKAKQIAEVGGDGSCLVAFAAGDGRVDIVTDAKTTDRACEIASDVSTLIEPKLPEPTA